MTTQRKDGQLAQLLLAALGQLRRSVTYDERLRARRGYRRLRGLLDAHVHTHYPRLLRPQIVPCRAQRPRRRLVLAAMVWGLATSTQAMTLVCLGDSNTHPYAFGYAQWCDVLQERHPDWTVLNLGRSGGILAWAGAFNVYLPPSSPLIAENQWTEAERLLGGQRPDLIVAAFGTNDLLASKDPDRVAMELAAFRDRLATIAPTFLGMVPRRWDVFRTPTLQRAANRALARRVDRIWRIPFDRVSQRYAKQPDAAHFTAAGQVRRADLAERAFVRAALWAASDPGTSREGPAPQAARHPHERSH